MKPISIFSAILILLAVSCSKKNQTSRSLPPGSVTKNIVYGSNKNYLGQQEDLALDIYYPFQTNPSGTKYPVIVWIHGGGFITGDKATADNLCRGFNDKGYIAVAINYRIGWNHTETDLCSGDTTQLKQAQYRAVQDTRAALRFLVSRADQYSIDTNWFFLAGSSAGCATTLHSAYLTQDSADVFLPGGRNTLGLLNNADNNLTNTYTLKGLGCMWGAIYSLGFITPGNAKPSIFFHGEKDIVAPVDEGYAYTCDNMLYVYGSISIYDRLTNFGVPAVIHIDPQGGHGVYSDQFRIDNTTCFFNDVMSGNAKKGYYTGEQGNCK